MNEIIPSSNQTAAVNTEHLHVYGNLRAKIVGVQYCRGYTNPGEQILMQREPGNPYDSNAIRVDNVAGTQIGHISCRIAANLAPFMDHSALHVGGARAGEVGTFDCPLKVHMSGPDPQSEEGVLLAAEMKAAKLSTNALKDAEGAEKQREKEREDVRKRRKQEEKQRLAESRRAVAAGSTGSAAQLPVNASQNGWTNQFQAGPGAQLVMEDILEAHQCLQSTGDRPVY